MLIECRECGGQVSDDADACPHCGYRMRGRELMKQCQHCGENVIPELNPHDSISLYCPMCNKPITRVLLRYASKTFWIALIGGLIIGVIWVVKYGMQFLP